MRIAAPLGGSWQRRGYVVATVTAALGLVVTLFVPGVPAANAAPETVAAPAAPAVTSTAGFDPSFIISDDLFYDSGAMTAAQIQSFLDGKIGTCLNSNCLNVATVPFAGRARDVSSTTGNLVCEAMPAATIKVSELIYRTQVACGISAKVILVTLQKEQGLVTSRAPDSVALRWAMGMACPDTAPCDTAFAGLATQIVAGTRQLKAYKAAAFGRQPGNQYVQWNPDASCGGTYLNVQSYGTAALYNYTPYQPNSAALANPYGIGDGCSSYGNRNFWVYYNDWFGSSVNFDPLQAIADRYAELGGASGALGAATGSIPSCTSSSNTCLRTFQHGWIHWKRGSGVHSVAGAIGDYVLANPTLTGYATAEKQDAVDPNGNGVAQQFERGWIHSGPSGLFWSPSSVMSVYSANGWLRGALGWPTSEYTCGGPSSRCIQWFAGGAISGPASGIPTVVPQALAAAYSTAGGTGGELGFPALDVQRVIDPNGNGFAWKLDNGWIHSSAAGTFVTSNAIMAEYSKRGWVRGALGWPTANQSCDVTGCEQQFAGGTIRISADSAMTDAAIAQVWRDLGGAAGALGAPIARPSTVADKNGNGSAQQFERGWIHSSAAGTFASSAAIMTEFSKQGWVRGWLGWPVAAAACDANGCAQDFANGTIAVATDGTPRSMPSVSNAQIRALYQSTGGAGGTLGYPVAAVQAVADPKGNGFAQRFEKAWVHSSSSGTFSTSNALMVAYSAQGWLRGTLGWPAAAETCSATGCGQRFQGGMLFAPTGGAAFLVPDVTNAQIKALYDTLGGATGTLGYATGASQAVTDANGNGVAQRFERGWIHTSAKGTFWSSTALMTAYSSAGWVRGKLGWPTANPDCGGASGACIQTFAGGAIASIGSTAAVLPDAIAAAYTTAGGPAGAWGYPLALPQSVTDPNGNGSAFKLEKGWVHASDRGAFFTTNTVMAEYSARGWLRGSLGWPTANEACDATGCAQSFSGGTIRYTYGGTALLVPALSNADIRAAWEAAGGTTGSLGYPISGVQTVTDRNGDGLTQQFERGWVHSSAAGTFAIPSVIMTRYSALGWLRYPSGIGWPTSAVACDATGCTQTFASASIRVPVGELMTESTISTAWQALGGMNSPLGAPLAAAQAVSDPNGNGYAQQFERGWIHSSAAGAFWTPSVVMTAYSSRGWVRGSLGWPTANPVCLPGGCTQAFQNGSIDTR